MIKGNELAGRSGSRVSAYVLQKAILHFYTTCRLFPAGVVAELDSVKDWSLKCAKALRRLVHGFILMKNKFVFLFGPPLANINLYDGENNSLTDCGMIPIPNLSLGWAFASFDETITWG